MFTTLTNWLRSSKRTLRQRPHRLGVLEALEERAVMNSTYANLFGNTGTFAQDWTNTGLITANNNWAGVPSIEGYNGAGLTSTQGTNPETITAFGPGNLTVLANQTDPKTLNPTFGIAEFESNASSNPYVALAGDSTNAAPFLLMYMDTRGTGHVQVTFQLVDDDDSARNVQSQVALQFRTSLTGNFAGVAFTDVPGAGYTADASNGPNARKTTSVSAFLPNIADNKQFVQIRIMTAFTSTPGEWIGVDNIVVHGNIPPILGIDSTKLTYTENDPATPIDPNASIVDPDSADFNTGSLTASFATPGTPFDRLLVNNQGTAPFQIGVTGGTTVTYNPGGGAATIGTITSDGIGANALTIVFTNANATQQAVLALLKDISYLNTSPDDPTIGVPQSPPTRDTVVRFVLDDGDGGVSAVATRPLSIFSVNDPPVIGLPTGAISVPELAPPRLLDAAASVADPDSHDFDTGTLTVSFPGGFGTSSDILAIQNQGQGAGQVGVVGSTVTFSGVLIGTFSGGTAGTDLVVTFNSASSLISVQAVLRNITFQNTSNNPPGATRAIRFQLIDGDGGPTGGISNNAQVSVTIQLVNDPPTLALSVSGITYTENDPATILDPGVVIGDPDSPDFSTGTLTVTVTNNAAAEDRLSVKDQGTGPQQIGVVGATVTYNPGGGAVTIGSITSSGSGTVPLQITFNNNSTIAAVQALARAITYFNVSDNPSTLTRTVSFVVNDGDGGTSTSAPVTMTVAVVAVNDAPTLGNFGTTVNYTAGLPAVLMANTATVTDPDSLNFNTGNLTVQITTGGIPADTLAIRNQGTGAGKIGVSGANVTFGGTVIGTFSGGTSNIPLKITFIASATPAAATALAQNINFRTPNGAGVIGDRVVTFTATDDQAATSTPPATVTVHVTSTAGPSDDFYETNEDITLTVPANGVLANDGPIPAQLTVNTTPISGTTNGTLALNADGSFVYQPRLNFNGTDNFTYQWINSTASTMGTALVTITVTAVNDAPTVQFTPPGIAVNEDGPAQSIANFAVVGPGGGTDESGQVLTKSISNNKNSLFTSQPAIDASGRLTFTTAKDQNGTATVTYTVVDDGGTSNPLDQDTRVATFDIVVNAVNDIPNFQVLTTQVSAIEDAGVQSVAGFASNFLPGPATATDEATQQPTYVLSQTGNTGPQSPTGKLEFAVAPSIDASGKLTYTAAPNSNGSATFNVVVVDGGGTAFGGVDTSIPHSFTIIVAPVNDPPTLGADSVTVLWNSDPNPIAVLANDSGSPDVGETITVIGVSQGTHGTVAIQPGGTGVTYQPNPSFVGTDSFQYTGSDGHGGTAIATVSVNVIRANTQSIDIVAIGSGVGGSAQVRILNSLTGQFIAGFAAFDPAFQGGVTVATGDVNGDGVTDVIVGAGPGGGPRVQIIDGTKFGLLQGANTIASPSAQIANFFVYDFSFTGGITVAAGDVNGDGKADIIVGAGPGGGPNVKVISGARISQIGPDGLPADSALLSSFFAYDPAFRGGVNVASGDVNGDGFADVITAAGPGGGSHVKAYSGQLLFSVGQKAPGLIIASFYAFDPRFFGGVNVAVGDLNGDGRADFIVGAGQGGGSHVKVYTPLNLATPIASFFAFGPDFKGGVDVGYRARSGGASPLLLTGTGIGASARFIAFAPPSYTAVENLSVFDHNFIGGIEVG